MSATGSLAEWRELANEPAIAAVRSLSRAVSAAGSNYAGPMQYRECLLFLEAAIPISGSHIRGTHQR